MYHIVAAYVMQLSAASHANRVGLDRVRHEYILFFEVLDSFDVNRTCNETTNFYHSYANVNPLKSCCCKKECFLT